MTLTAAASFGADYTPNRPRLPLDKSVNVATPWNEHIRFLFNRGPGAVSFHEEVLKLLSTENIRKAPGFTSPAETRVTLMTYELRSRDVVERVEELVAEGFNVRIVADSGTFTYVEAPTEAQWASWNESQRNYFKSHYGEPGEMGARVAKVNAKRRISHDLWERVQALQKKHPALVDLAPTPFEVVPTDPQALYTRLSHLKRTEIAVKGPQGSWIPSVAMLSSANLTMNCLKCNLNSSNENVDAYLAGGEYAEARGSEGHIQFGAIVTGAEALAAIGGPTEEWISLYKQGKHFDSAKARDKQLPRVVLGGGDAVTTLQAFYSEGTKLESRSAEDPIWALTQILARPENKLKVFYDAQFVFTHRNMARHLRHQLIASKEHGGLEAFGVFVDGNFATESFSALPDLVFAHKLDNSISVSAENAIQRFEKVPAELDWPKNVFVFDGKQGVSGGTGDKLHAKSSYFEYLDAKGVRHFVVAWGSANKSSNAGKLNADGLFVLDSRDPAVGELVRPFFESLREEKRMRPYSQAYLEERLLELVQPREELFGQAGKRSDFIPGLADALTEGATKAQLEKIVARLDEAGAVNGAGKNFLDLLRWLSKNLPDEYRFAWADLHVALALAHPATIPQPGLVRAASRLWVKSKPESKLTALVDSMVRLEAANRMKLAPELLEIMNQCEATLTRLDFPVYKGGKKK